MFTVEAKCFHHYRLWLCFRTKSETITRMDIKMMPKLRSVRNKWAHITWLLTGWSSIRSKAWPNQTALWAFCTEYLTVIPVINSYVESVYLFVCLCLSTALGFIVETVSPCVSNGDEVRLQGFFSLYTQNHWCEYCAEQRLGWWDAASALHLDILNLFFFSKYLFDCCSSVVSITSLAFVLI